MPQRHSRRTFLTASAGMAALSQIPFAVSPKQSQAAYKAPSEIPVIGMIGAGIRFAPLARAGSKYANCGRDLRCGYSAVAQRPRIDEGLEREEQPLRPYQCL